MSEFKKGQKVKVELEGTVRLTVDDDTWLQVHPDGYGPGTDLSLSLKGIKVTILDPPDWPPQVGDIWEADGEEWFVRQAASRKDKDMTLLISETGYVRQDQDHFKTLKPVLVRRREKSKAIG